MVDVQQQNLCLLADPEQADVARHRHRCENYSTDHALRAVK